MNSSIRLEFLNESHVVDLATIANDEAIDRMSGVLPHCDEVLVREWIQENSSASRTEIRFVILVDNRVAGCCMLKKLNLIEHTAELAYWLGVDYWGKGIATSAAAMLCDFAFEAFNLTFLIAHFLKSNNRASGRVLDKLGFVPDKNREDMAVEGRFTHLAPDVWTFVCLTRDRWQSTQNSTSWSLVSKE